MLALHVISDGLIALAYFSIPALLIWFARRRSDLPFRGIFAMFAIFILSCGSTHVLAIWTIWHPDYWLDGAVKAVTAVASVATAVALVPLLPRALALRSPRELERINRELASTLDDLARERHIASVLQTHALGSELPDVDGFGFSADYAPATTDLEIGGDWYDAFRLEDGRIAMSIGDVTGNGLGSAVIMAKVRQSLRAAAYIQIDPSAMLDAADRALRSEYPDRIVTAFLAIVDPAENTLTFAGAGHPWPLLRRADGTIVEIGTSCLPLGLRDREAPEAESIAFGPGDLLVLFTDGLIETTRDLDAGARRLRDAVAAADANDASLAASIRRVVTNDVVRDDIAVLTVAVRDRDPATFARMRFASSDGEAAARARAVVRERLAARGADDADAIAAELVFSELVGNACRYAPGPIDVVIDTAGPLPVLHVFDSGAGYRHVPTLPADVYAENGRGLFLIATLAEDFHVAKRPDGGSHARAVLKLRPTNLRRAASPVRDAYANVDVNA